MFVLIKHFALSLNFWLADSTLLSELTVNFEYGKKRTLLFMAAVTLMGGFMFKSKDIRHDLAVQLK